MVDAGLLSAVIDHAPTPLWVIGHDGTVELVNRAAANLLGYRSVHDLVGAPSHDTLHEWRPDGSRYPSHACPIVEHAAAQTRSTPEWFITRVGQAIPVSWSTRPLGVEGAKLLSFTDATERYEARCARTDEPELLAAAEATAAPSRDALRAGLLAHVRSRFRDPEFTPLVLATEFHLSLRAVQQLLAEDGYSPATEIRCRRIEFARALIARGAPVHDACRASGFREVGTFTRAFRRQYGQSPTEWARSLT